MKPTIAINTYMTEFSTYQLLTDFKNKACAWQSQNKAGRIYELLKGRLLENEHVQLGIAWRHYQLGESAKELFGVCETLLLKYRS